MNGGVNMSLNIAAWPNLVALGIIILCNIASIAVNISYLIANKKDKND